MSWENYGLLARAETLRKEGPTLTAMLDSIPHIEQLKQDASNAAALQAVRRLAQHFDMVFDCLEQTTTIADAGYSIEWASALQSIKPVQLKSRPDLPIFVLRNADMLRMKAFTLVTINRVRDYLDLTELSSAAGHRPTAAAVAVMDETFVSDSAGGTPLATQLVRRLAKPRPRIRKLHSATSNPPSPKRWAEMSESASKLSSYILLASEPRGTARPEVESSSPEELAQSISQGDLVEWQNIADVVRRKPWGAFARSLPAATKIAGDEAVATALHEVVEYARVLRDQREREEIAKRITRCVLATGLTQKAMASRIGTSASRLSTYMTGSVTPSASMLIRIEAQLAEIDEERKSGLV